MFIDKARIYVEAGNGGDGMSSFRREKFVEKGGPNGGNGGRGGNVILRADINLNTLIDFRYKRKFIARPGDRGGISNMTGHRGEDVIVKVPMGTVVRDDETNIMIADLTEDGQEFIAAKGGRGGKGNACYATSTKRAPTFAEKGEPGTKGWLRLELKLLADVGLVGYPSVGKSSIISRVSAARPEIAAYHFTTLTPVLGVVRLSEEQSFVLADIPGLIEGAAEGVGLGHDFLRHIERTKKMDLPDSEENLVKLKEYVQQKGYEIMAVSAVTGEGLQELMWKAYGMVQQYVPEPEEEIGVIDEGDPDSFEIIRGAEDADFEVKGKNIERLVAMTNFDNEEALYRFQLIWKRLKIEDALLEAGIQEGQTVRILDMVFNYQKSKWADRR